MLGRWIPVCVATAAAHATVAKADSGSGDTGKVDSAPDAQTAPVAVRREAGYRDHRFHFDLIFGADTRVGELGMSFEYALGDLLSLGAGVGTNGFGPEWAANARLRPVWWRTPNGSFFHALTLEGSVSRATENSGFVLCIDDCVDTSVVPQTVYWAQGELGWEGMLRDGFTFRASSGFANAIGSRLWHCSEYAAHCEPPPRQFFVQTFALGVAF